MRTTFRIAALFLLSLLAAPVCVAQDLPIHSGQKIAFLGDSITQFGWEKPFGYVHLVVDGLDANGIKVTAIPAGVSGNTSKDMIARLDRDVISKKPDWMTMSCGVNDVWHGAKGGVPLDQYKKNITEIVDRAQAANIKVMILTSTMITENQSAANNQTLIAYNDFLRSLAKDKGCLLADLNADMQAALAAAPSHAGNYLTQDGVHMIAPGNKMMANGILKAFGLTGDQLAEAHKTWREMADAIPLSPLSVSEGQYEKLKAIAAQRKVTVDQLVTTAEKQAIDSLTESQADPAPAK